MGKSDEVFKKIEARIAKVDPNKRSILHVFKFVITDDSGKVLKTWILDLKQVKLYESATAEAEVTIKLSESTLVDITTGKIDSIKALNDDLVDVEGNLELVFLLQPFISTL